MTFTSFEFLLFFPLVVLFYNLCSQRLRLYYLIVVSYIFYALMQPIYLLLLAAVSVITYCFAIFLGKVRDEKNKNWILALGIVVIVLPLFFFKYYNFVNYAIISGLEMIGIHCSFPVIKLLLPVGISFYTFMSIGYLIDVYNEDVKVEANMGVVCLFLSFFPYLLSGPIERAGNIFPQLKKMPASQPLDLTSGAKMMLWGYFMKLCIADRLGIYVDSVFNNISQHNGTTLTLASLLYPIQVYGDLGGYSLIAMGVARCMGIKIIPNFNRPFFATSMSELWRRWHMSLIKWLTDYIYTPLSFTLRNWKVWGVVCALMLTFLISGIWHGAAVTFVMWGIVQGFYLSIEALILKRRIAFEAKYKLNDRLWYITFCCVIVYLLFAFSQIYGRCSSIEEAHNVVYKIFNDRGDLFVDFTNLGYGFIMFLILFIKDFLDEYFPGKINKILSNSFSLRIAVYIIILFMVINMGVLDSGQFIYFQF